MLILAILFIFSMSPTESVYERYPELRDTDSLVEVMEIVGTGPEKDYFRRD